MLQMTAIDLGDPGRDNIFGFGWLMQQPCILVIVKEILMLTAMWMVPTQQIFKTDFGRNQYNNPCETS